MSEGGVGQTYIFEASWFHAEVVTSKHVGFMRLSRRGCYRSQTVCRHTKLAGYRIAPGTAVVRTNTKHLALRGTTSSRAIDFALLALSYSASFFFWLERPLDHRVVCSGPCGSVHLGHRRALRVEYNGDSLRRSLFAALMRTSPWTACTPPLCLERARCRKREPLNTSAEFCAST